eukprot:c8258_g1_i1 orf=779-1015(+)
MNSGVRMLIRSEHFELRPLISAFVEYPAACCSALQIFYVPKLLIVHTAVSLLASCALFPCHRADGTCDISHGIVLLLW